MNASASPSMHSDLNAGFLEEYSTLESIRKYTKETAGNGISYLLDHDYGQIYLDVLQRYIPKSSIQRGVRLWEFGCGGGMNLLHLVSTMERRGILLGCAHCTGFFLGLLDAAKREASKNLSPTQPNKGRFFVGRN